MYLSFLQFDWIGFRDLNGLVFARNKNEMSARLPKFHMSTKRPI